MIAWTLAEGIAVVRSVELVAIAHGFHAAIGGSCLHRGASRKDLDIILFPHKTGAYDELPNDKRPLIEALRFDGFLDWKKLDHEYQGDGKIVYRADYLGKRIDFFFLK